MLQTYSNMREFEKTTHTRPLLTGGDDFWTDYILTARFALGPGRGRSGVAFRYANSRLLLLLWRVRRSTGGAKAKMVRHEHEDHKPLDPRQPEANDWRPGDEQLAEVHYSQGATSKPDWN